MDDREAVDAREGAAALPWRRDSVRRIALLSCMLATAAGIWFLVELPVTMRLTLAIFALAVMGWCLSRLDDTLIALAAVAALIASGAVPAESVYAGLGNAIIWLVIGAFMLAAMVQRTGLVERGVFAMLRPFRTVGAVFYALSLAILATAFFIPSTSGRAALFLPVYLALAGALEDARVVRALGLLIPSVILLSAFGSMIGAGGNLVAADFIATTTGQPLTYASWAALALPFSLASSAAVTWLILQLFVGREGSRARLVLPDRAARAPDGLQLATGAMLVVMLAALGTMPWHGIEAPMVLIAGALILSLVPGAPSVAEAVRSVEWSLVLFLAASLALGHALVESGVAAALAAPVFDVLGARISGSPILVAGCVALVALGAHLLINSRTARVFVLIPVVALPFAALGYRTDALIFLVAAGAGFCQTLAISSKPVAIYARQEAAPFDGGDLLKLAVALLPVQFALLLLFSLLLWPAMGLPFSR